MTNSLHALSESARLKALVAGTSLPIIVLPGAGLILLGVPARSVYLAAIFGIPLLMIAVSPLASKFSTSYPRRLLHVITLSRELFASMAPAEVTVGYLHRLTIGAAALALISVGSTLFLHTSFRDAAPPPEPPTLEARIHAASLIDPKPAGGHSEETNDTRTQLAMFVESRTAEAEATLKAQYESRLLELMQLLEAQTREAERQEADLLRQQRIITALQRAELERAARNRGASASRLRPDRSFGAMPTPAAPATAELTQQLKSPLRTGDLVAFGPGVSPPKLLSIPTPVLPEIAKRLRKSTLVEVRVLVDEEGKVQNAELIGEKVGFGFDQAALDTARRATYKPAEKDGVRVRIWTQLRISFEM